MSGSSALPKFRPKAPEVKVQKVTARSAFGPAERIANIRVAALRGLPQMPTIGEHGETMAIAGYGPSLLRSLPELAREAAHVWTVSGAHDVLLDAGIRTRGHIEADPRPHKARFLSRPQKDVCYLLASACGPESFRALEGADVRIWHVLSTVDETEEIKRLWPDAFLLRAGTNVGISAIAVGFALGYRRFRLYGIDCSFSASRRILEWPKEEPLPILLRQEIGFHAGPHANEDQAPLRITIPGDPPRTFITSPQMLQAAQDFIELYSVHPEMKLELRGDGMLPALIAALDAGLLGAEPVPFGEPGSGRVTFAI